MTKEGKINTLILGMDVVGFALVLAGTGLIRYAKDEIISILGGFVLAGGVTVIGLTRLISK